MNIHFKKLQPDAVSPSRAHPDDAGWDLTLARLAITNGVWYCSTGIAVEIPLGYFGLLRPRSSLAKKRYVMASSGVIDAGYRGEIVIPLREVGHGDSYEIGDRICQLIILPLPDVAFVEQAELSETVRGTGGFGSTGN
jgi:dUTP pyrophosphatase